MKVRKVYTLSEKGYVQGTHFEKGHYIPERKYYWGVLITGEIIELSAEKIRSYFQRKRITSSLFERMKGLDSKLFEKK